MSPQRNKVEISRKNTVCFVSKVDDCRNNAISTLKLISKGGIRMNSKDQHTVLSYECMLNKNRFTQKCEMNFSWSELVRQREIVLFAVI